MAIVRIKDLRLRTIIGINDWEREEEQDIIVNIEFEFDARKAAQSDNIKDTVDYKTITKNIIEKVKASEYFLLEKLTDMILKIVLENGKVEKARVRVDKPFALRFADSVSVELEGKRK